MKTEDYIKEVDAYCAHNYHPLPIIISKADGIWMYDIDGKKYMDMLSAYSALNQGHMNPKILKAAHEQMKTLTLTSRAFHNDKMGAFLKYLVELLGMEMALPMNTGAEAIETAIKAIRRWGYYIKKVEEDKAEIIVCENNFHGRTTTIVGFSSEDQYKDGFGPFTPGFKIIPFNDLKALEEAITPNTVAFLVEPIQGEAGVIVPDDGYLKKAKEICEKNNVMLILDEIQTGLGRTGKLFAYEHDEIKPDVLCIGKALGGGVYPVSAVVSSKEILGVFKPGDHGSTFGGNPLGSAVGMASLKVIVDDKLTERSAELGNYFMEQLKAIESKHVKEIRGKGLFIGVVIKDDSGTARPFCEALMKEGILAKDTHHQVIRFAPPLVITKEELDWALERIKKVLQVDDINNYE